MNWILLHCIASVSMDIHWITATCHQIFVLLLVNLVLVPDIEYISSSIILAELHKKGSKTCSGLFTSVI